MPFTPSHAVVALPFLRTPLVPAAIAVGAMTPDLPLFVRGTPIRYGWTHDLAWLPVTMLLALALLLVWRCVLRPAARELSPAWVAARLPGEWDAGAGAALRETFGVQSAPGSLRRPWTAVALLVVSLVIGVASHILWDLFTHEGRWGAAVLPALEERWGPLLGLKWLQHGSSVLGVTLLAVWALLWLRRRNPAGPSRLEAPADASASSGGGVGTVHRLLPAWVRWVWLISLPAILAAALAIGYVAHGPFTPAYTPQHLAYGVLPPACAVWGALTLALCVAVHVVRAARRSSPVR